MFGVVIIIIIIIIIIVKLIIIIIIKLIKHIIIIIKLFIIIIIIIEGLTAHAAHPNLVCNPVFTMIIYRFWYQGCDLFNALRETTAPATGGQGNRGETQTVEQQLMRNLDELGTKFEQK